MARQPRRTPQPPAARFQLEGMQDVRKALRQLSDSSKKDMKVAHRAVADVVANQAKFEVPVRSGRLRRSIRGDATITMARVKVGGARVPYAAPIHFGWPTRPKPTRGWRGGPIRPNPFVYEAADKRIDDVVAVYEARIGDLIRSYRLDG